MVWLVGLLLLGSPETERMLLGPSPFFREEGLRRAVAESDQALIEAAARSPHWDARRLAALALGSRCPRELLDDPVAVVREAAVRALDTACPPERLGELAKDEDDAVRAAVAWALRATRAHRALRELRRDPSITVQVTALAASGRFSDLKTMATRRELPLAVPALWALGRAGREAEASFLVSRFSRAVRDAAKEKLPLYLRNDPEPDVALARAVGDFARRGIAPGGKSIASLLRKIAEDSGLEGSAPLLLAEAIAGAQDAAAAQQVLDSQIRIRKTSTLPDAYYQPALEGMVHAFGREDWEALSPLLLPALEDRDPAVRLAVMRVVHGPSALLGLRDADPAVRAAACERVDRLKALRAALLDTSPAVQAAAARGIGRLGDPAGAEALGPVLENADAAVRHAAVGALLRLDFAGRGEVLYRVALRDADAEVRAAAGAVLAFLEEPGVLERAIADLGADDEAVRSHAIDLVRALTAARVPYDAAQPAKGVALWQEWWRKRRERADAPDAFRYHVEDLRRQGIDLVLVIDATGSMSPLIEATKRRLQAVVERLRSIVPDLRARIVAYRDSGDAFLTLGSPLTHESRILEDFLACIPASGGGDGPEAVLAGLRDAIERTPWRERSHRVVLLFGDAPHHERDEALLQSILGEFKGVVHTVDASALALGGGSAGHANEASFRKIAAWGRGSFLRVADDTSLLRQILVLTLGPAHRTAIETLFGL